MGIVVRQSVLTSIISYIGIIVGYVNLLYLYPKFLDLEQVGLLRTIQDAAILMTPFATFGLAQSIVRFLPQLSDDKKQAGNFFSFVLFLSLITYGIFLIVFFILKNEIISLFIAKAGDVVEYIGLILWLTFFLLGITLLEQYARSLLKAAFPAFLREVGLRVLQGALVFMYFSKLISFDQFLLLSVLIYTILLVLLIFYLLSLGHFRLSLAWNTIPRERIKEILVFSSLSFVGTSSMILVGKMDSVMVAAMLGLESNALYTTAFYMATVIEIPKRALSTIASPLIAKSFGKNDLNEILMLYRKTSINQFIIGALLLVGVLCNFSNIFDLMPKGDAFRSAQYVVVIVGFGKLIDMAFGPSSEIIGLSKHYWFNLVVITLLAATTITANYLLIPSMGINGAAFGSLIALVIYNVVKFAFIWFKLSLQPFSTATFKVMIITGLVLLIGLYLPKFSNALIDIAYRSTIVTIVYGSLILWSKSSDDVEKIFRMLLGKIRLK
jgi:O-antigen/teichoic acid export membrane protein